MRHDVVRRWAPAIMVAALGLQPAAGHAQEPAPVRTVPFVDLDRYVGDWFEIARFPNRFQRECVGDVRTTYGRRPDGRIDVVNRCRTAQGETEARGVARVVDDQGFARLKVRFAPGWLSWLPVVWGDYWIIGLAPDYSWAVVGEPGREYLWILARDPQIGGEAMAAARAAARASGYDVERLEPTPQAEAGR
jgi:apolipoprotein D and lipocalin family protein